MLVSLGVAGAGLLSAATTGAAMWWLRRCAITAGMRIRELVHDRLLLAKPDAGDAEIERTLTELGGIEIVRRLADGLDTNVGEAGATLSDGQRQVIALARTVLANPSIFILDEFTSGLDVLTEARLLDALDRLLAGRTRIVIAHRPGMVKRADHIVVLESGRVTQQGDHENLMTQVGPYAALQEQYTVTLAGR